LRKIALASFAGYAFSYNFGATLFGTSIRYRLYSAWGVPLLKIVKLLVILGLTFWFGVFGLAGVVFVVTPFSIPAGLNHLKLPFAHTFWVGVALLLIAAAMLGRNEWRLNSEPKSASCKYLGNDHPKHCQERGKGHGTGLRANE
jgi:uncharacterized membrane protein YbhN (UPF0104 family)